MVLSKPRKKSVLRKKEYFFFGFFPEIIKDKDRKWVLYWEIQALDKLDKGHFDGIMGGSRSLMGHEKEMEARVHEF